MPRTDEAAQSHAKRLRSDLTFTERTLWSLLRNRRLDGLKFRRQVAIGPYIADFVCFSHRLIVEADGPMHEDRTERDAIRDGWLRSQGFEVLRFSNRMITLYPEQVLEEILTPAPRSHT
jgi:very-short-patch-repair endonuclease